MKGNKSNVFDDIEKSSSDMYPDYTVENVCLTFLKFSFYASNYVQNNDSFHILFSKK
jgi:hypothetical protein